MIYHYHCSSQLGYRQDVLNDMFWLMTFSKSASFIGSQILANWLVGGAVGKPIGSLFSVTVLLAIINIIFVTRGWKESPKLAAFKDYRTSLYTYVIGGKKCLSFIVFLFIYIWNLTFELSQYLNYPTIRFTIIVGKQNSMKFQVFEVKY